MRCSKNNFTKYDSMVNYNLPSMDTGTVTLEMIIKLLEDETVTVDALQTALNCNNKAVCARRLGRVSKWADVNKLFPQTP
jgi:hypothetical protein